MPPGHCRGKPGNRGPSGLLFPIEIGTDVGASLAAAPTDEPWLQIGQPDVIGPSVRAHGRPVAAAIIGTVNQETAHASGAHLSEGDLLLAGEGGHAPLKRGRTLETIVLSRLTGNEAGRGRAALNWQRCKPLPRSLTGELIVEPWRASC
jgi:hypothetical protein